MSLCLIASAYSHAFETEWSGYINFEVQGFLEDALTTQQSKQNLSASFQPEMYFSWNSDKQSIIFTPFFRLDRQDDERSHADVRELMFLSTHGDWEYRIGIGKVFWGVTESQHLVDIINQTDLIESIDGEEKLGQPMFNLSLIHDWGTTDLFILPGFRTRTFPGLEGRPRTIPYIDTSQEQFTHRKGDNHVDFAIRYNHTIDDWDIGLSHFYGTDRSPDLSPGLDSQGRPALIPTYNLLRQTGVDLQWVYENWLWKLEAVHRNKSTENYNAATFGFEYTFNGIFETAMDIGLISEALYDSRGLQANTPFQRDYLLAGRLVFNDTQSSEILFGVIFDPDLGDRSYSVEATTRLTDYWKINIEARIFSNIDPGSLLYSSRNDDFIQLELFYYF